MIITKGMYRIHLLQVFVKVHKLWEVQAMQKLKSYAGNLIRKREENQPKTIKM